MSMSILVVDNHPVMLKFMTDLLRKEGHHVMTARDGLAALDILKGFTPGVLFVDLIMPHVNGERLCRIIRKNPRLKDAFVVILSAIAADEEIDFLRFGANACIAKAPFDQMRQHVLAVLKQAGAGPTPSGGSRTLGTETMQPRQITRELLTVKRHFEIVLESMKEGVLEITPDARIVYANRMALSIIGRPEELLVASSLVDLFGDTERTRMEKLVHGEEEDRDAFGKPLEFVMDGKPVSVKLIPLENSARGSIVILEDLTERKRMEAQLIRAEKMEAIGTLAGGIAHDFNNILTAIFGNLSLAKTDVSPGSPVAERLEEMERASWKAKDLARQLLPFSRGGTPIKKRVSVPSLLQHVPLDWDGDRKWQTRLFLSDDLWDVEVDPFQIQQAITHLVTNAFEAMPEGGTVRINAANFFARTENGAHMRKGTYVKISVADDGVGIPDANLARVFDPYFTTKKTGKGLGLAMVYTIMERHQGGVTLESRPNRGTVFHLYLPAVGELNNGDGGKPEIQGRKGIRVLLMDDEELIRGIAAQMIQHLGYSVELAREGGEALTLYEKASEEGRPFHVVILDLTVPAGMGGKEAMEKLLHMDPEARVIVSSGYSNDPIMSDYASWGFKGLLEKPYQMSDLEKELERVRQQ